MRISYWSSDVCSSYLDRSRLDLPQRPNPVDARTLLPGRRLPLHQRLRREPARRGNAAVLPFGTDLGRGHLRRRCALGLPQPRPAHGRQALWTQRGQDVVAPLEHCPRLRPLPARHGWAVRRQPPEHRSEEHTSELQSLMRISYAVFCLKKKNKKENKTKQKQSH